MAATTTSAQDMGTVTTTLHPNTNLLAAVATMSPMPSTAPYETSSPSQQAPHTLATGAPVPTPASAPTAPAPVSPAPAGGSAASAAAAAAAAAASASRSVKRPRPVKSCTECRKRKLRCDRNLPCSQCQKSHRNCRYAAEHDSSMLSDGSDAEVGDHLQRPPKRNCVPAITPSGPPPAESSFVPLRNGESAGHSALEELTLRLDRLERQFMIKSPAGTEFSGSGQRLPLSPGTIRGLTVKRGALRTRFFGQNSVRVLLNLFDDAKDFMANQSKIEGIRDIMYGLQILHKRIQEEYRKSLSPISVFADSVIPVQKRMHDILPKKAVCDRLLASYIDTSETIYRMIHVPTFKEQHELFWDGKLPGDDFLPQLLAVLSIGSRFETKSKGLGHERVEGVHIPTACALVRSWLDGLRGKQLVDLTTLQTEILLVHAQRMTTPRPQDSWAQLGYIVRMAMTMGLHRDPSEFEPRMPVFLGELRRRLWFTILDMDLHLSLACNLSCLVREGDFTCRPPRNLDDADLYFDMKELPPSKPIDQLTDNQMQVYAAMTLGVRMQVAHLINRVDSVRDYGEIIEVGTKLDRFLEDINYLFPRHGILNEVEKSKQWRSRVILDMHVRRPLLALYRPFALGLPDAPSQISRAYLRSSMVIMRYLDELDPLLTHFQDVSDMYHMVLKKDILQAAFSVCFYIKAATESHANGNTLGIASTVAMSPDPMDDGVAFSTETFALWSPSRLIKTVEKTLNLLVRNVGGNDLKDIVALAVVLASVQTASQEQKLQEIRRSLQGVLDACKASTNASPEKMSLQTPADPMDPYMQTRAPFMFHANASAAAVSDHHGGWVLWDGWDWADAWSADSG
ncbi:fungal specific transcription factor domain-containing protein [Colletotrichum higginsianum IMI 349063]|uniref:Fungal specific transcription factor domain-containing protein n=2 Tax=Colletotrichum higginsianum (strain IMI 349063) TaxID=759273 RepID=A0A1B7Y2S7_COLHI|nr:fungal specific transcription factor domain-containing protein [Colletotrichum higginsianum IMI 349063]OBR06311.1 fungal specific transcription factor domain-containing protein [Colletotrichum higginsianum IMI 349063]